MAKINFLADWLGVTSLLDKYPEQLSGGERQRISVIRALLLDPDVIIADEPTASLDQNNATQIANLIERLKAQNKIVIIATHENCFDEIADEIISLDYGKIGEIKRREAEVQHLNDVIEHDSFPLSTQNAKSSAKWFFNYTFKRNRKKFKLLKLLPLALVFLFIFIAASVQNNFSDSYYRLLRDRFPFEVFSVNGFDLHYIPDDTNIRIYNDYRYTGDNYTAFVLLNREDSAFAFDGTLSYGVFPNTNNEILVTSSYVENVLNIQSFETAIGSSVLIAQREFVISGVVNNRASRDAYDIIFSNVFYNRFLESDENYVFVPYDTLRQFGSVATDFMSSHMVSWRGLYQNQRAVNELRDNISRISIFDTRIMNIQYTINAVSLIILGALILGSIIAILFMQYSVKLEMFYRKRELGYLQVFGVSKQKIKRVFLFEYLLRAFFSLTIAFLLYVCIATTLFFVFGIIGALPLLYISFIFVFVLVFCILAVYLPCAKFLKQNVINLIK